jgi:hypothetical protein
MRKVEDEVELIPLDLFFLLHYQRFMIRYRLDEVDYSHPISGLDLLSRSPILQGQPDRPLCSMLGRLSWSLLPMERGPQ